MMIHYDNAIFLWINSWPHPQFLNWVAIALHYSTRGMVIYAVLIAALLFKKKYRQTIFVLASILITSGITDLILKPLIHRTRPFIALANVLALHPLPTSYSFPSSETAVAFAAASASSLIFQSKQWRWLWAWAVLTGIGRMYMGHHYPSDVVAGAIIGAAIPLLIQLVFRGKSAERGT